MTNKIKEKSDFKSKIENNPFTLLQAIKEHVMNYQEKRYEDIDIDKIKAKGKLSRLYKAIPNHRRSFEAHIGGPSIMKKVLMTIPGYK
jgi:hypothetical protein